MNSDFTFVFDNDGKAHAMKAGKVVASADSVEQLEAIVKQAAPPMLGNGSSGAGVSSLQNSLGVNADGQFGPQTEQAVKDYQQQNNLAVDGVAGPDTMNSLQAGKNDGAGPTMPPTNGLEAYPNSPKPFSGIPQPGAYDKQFGDSHDRLLTNEDSGFTPPAAGSMMDPSPKMPNGVPPTPQPSAPGGPLDTMNKGMGQKLFGSKEAKDCNCWDGYDRVPGTKPCSEGSCKKCDDHRSKESATHVITPNGLKGRILGKTKDMWGDTVTVRFENGRIVQFPTSDSLRYASEQEEVLSVTASLRERLNAPIEGDSGSLVSRINELKSIRREAQVKIANGDASFEDESELDNIAVEADAELGQVVAALDHINDENTDAYRPPTMHVAEQASLGGNDGTWLDDAFSTMVSEASSTDYDKLMSEGPEAFVAELDTAALANAGATREIASSHIRSKTAGANPQARNSFETAWIDRVETLRRKEILNRKTKAKKEAAAETDHSNLPDDILFG